MIFLGKEVKNGSPIPYIVAEISCNHGGSLEKARVLIEEAKQTGVDAVKIQCYDANALTLPTKFEIAGSSLWAGKNLYELYMESSTPYEWIGPMFEHAEKIGITIFSSVYDDRGLQELTRLGCRAFKIASYEANDPTFIQKVVATGKPVVLSTGGLNDIEIDKALNILDPDNSILLHCISDYPCELENISLAEMSDLTIHCDQPVGFSCHCDDPLAVILAADHGAAMIEVHLALEDAQTLDNEFSYTKESLTYTINTLHRVAKAQACRWGEEEGIKYKRSLFALKDIKVGEIFTNANIGSFRPNLGCSPSLMPDILGRKSKQAISKFSPMKMEYVK